MRKEKEMQTDPRAVIQGEHYRISLLTEALVRLEYSPEGIFEDRATQAVVNRNFPVPAFRVGEKNGLLTVTTERLVLEYDKKSFSPEGLSIRVLGNCSNYRSTWYYGAAFTDLGGTARTLDKADGAVPLSKGLISKNGFSVYDDSHSLIQTEDGWVAPRQHKGVDLYFFGYGHDYKQCLKDFYRLCGPMPLLPRYALGNWWSRYYKYTEKEYRALIERFEKEGIPFSVAVMDMDWHLVDVDPKYGSGWTGYTWNKALFPEPEQFMQWLHEKNYRITLNVHPAAGVRAYEEAYLPMAKALGADWEQEETIAFDVTDRSFLEAYFTYLHHPNEEAGVDFWWIDWQQQSHSRVEGLDPLWMLNHYHFQDSARNGKRPLTFSRYAGIGSHRYPVGFSGDTYITWASLDFQPYFTATASNVGYGWWSHDIGGHMHGTRDDELAVRWLQFGVFSPINRLHSSDNLFAGKEPWNFRPEAEAVMVRFLRLRHQLLPYLYSMNKRAAEEGEPLLLPLYYEHPEETEAYEQKNEYYFGTKLIAAPVTQPMDRETLHSKTPVWLPEGIWYDFFTGVRYVGGCRRNMFRTLETIPVLAKAGAVIPMNETGEDNAVTNPESIRLRAFTGKADSFVLWEDAGDTAVTREEGWCRTEISLGEMTEQELKLTISAAQGNTAVIPEKRRWIVELIGISAADIRLEAGGMSCQEAIQEVRVLSDGQGVRTEVSLKALPVNKELVLWAGGIQPGDNQVLERAKELLMHVQTPYDEKQKILQQLLNVKDRERLLSVLFGMELTPYLYGALAELLGA